MTVNYFQVPLLYFVNGRFRLFYLDIPVYSARCSAFVEWGQLIRDRFSALKVPILPICTHDEVGDQILSALGYSK